MEFGKQAGRLIKEHLCKWTTEHAGPAAAARQASKRFQPSKASMPFPKDETRFLWFAAKLLANDVGQDGSSWEDAGLPEVISYLKGKQKSLKWLCAMG